VFKKRHILINKKKVFDVVVFDVFDVVYVLAS